MSDFDTSGLPEGYLARVVESSSYARHCQWLILDADNNLFTKGTNYSLTSSPDFLVEQLAKELEDLSRDARNYERNRRKLGID